MVDSPYTLTPTQRVGPTAPGTPGRPSDAEIRRLREVSKALQEQQKKPAFYTWANGLDDFTKALTEGSLDRRASEMERANTGTERDLKNPYLQGGEGAGGPFTEQPPTPRPQRVASLSPDLPSSLQDSPQASPAVSPQGNMGTPETSPPTPSSPTADVSSSPTQPISEQTRVAQALQGRGGDDLIRRSQMIESQLVGAGVPRDAAARYSQQLLENRMKMMPQYQLDEYGRPIRTAPGQIPQIGSQPVPNFVPKGVPVPGIPGAIQRQTPAGNDIYTPRIVPTTPSPRSEITPPAVVGGRGTAQAAPVPPPGAVAASAAPTAPSAPQTMLGNTPGMIPKTPLEPWQVAMNEGIGNLPVPGKDGTIKTAQAAAAENTKPISPVLNPKDPIEAKAIQTLKEADEDPAADVEYGSKAGTMLDRAGKLSATNPAKAMDILSGIEGQGKAAQKVYEDTQLEQNKIYQKVQSGIAETGDQALKLRPSLKSAMTVMDSKDWQSGQFAKAIELFEGGRQSAGQIGKMLAEDETMPKAVRDAGKAVQDWGEHPENHQATANQVYTKLIAGLTLQGMRGMLGTGAGRFMQSELALMQNVLGNNNLTPEANKIVISIFDKVNDRNILIHKMANEYVKQHGKLDASFDQHVTQFNLDNPPYDHSLYDKALKMTAPEKKEGTSETPSTETTTPKKKAVDPRIQFH